MRTTLTSLEHVTSIRSLDARSPVQGSSAVVRVDGVFEVALKLLSVLVIGWREQTHHASTVVHIASRWILALVCHGELNAMAASWSAVEGPGVIGLSSPQLQAEIGPSAEVIED